MLQRAMQPTIPHMVEKERDKEGESVQEISRVKFSPTSTD